MDTKKFMHKLSDQIEESVRQTVSTAINSGIQKGTDDKITIDINEVDLNGIEEAIEKETKQKKSKIKVNANISIEPNKIDFSKIEKEIDKIYKRAGDKAVSSKAEKRFLDLINTLRKNNQDVKEEYLNYEKALRDPKGQYVGQYINYEPKDVTNEFLKDQVKAQKETGKAAKEASKTIIRAQDDIQDEIKETNKSIEQEKQRLETLKKQISGDNSTSGKAKATADLRFWNQKINDANGSSTDSQIVAYMNARMAAEKIGVAQSSLDRYFNAEAIGRYPRALKNLEHSAKITETSIEELEARVKGLNEEFLTAPNLSKSDKAWINFVDELNKVENESEETKQALKEAIEISSNQDAGSAIDALAMAYEKVDENARQAANSVQDLWIRSEGGSASNNFVRRALNEFASTTTRTHVDNKGNVISSQTWDINYDKMKSSILQKDREILALEYQIQNAQGDTSGSQRTLDILKQQRLAYFDILDAAINDPIYEVTDAEKTQLNLIRQIEQEKILGLQQDEKALALAKAQTSAEKEYANEVDKANKLSKEQASKQNNTAAAAYDKLTQKAKEYYKLQQDALSGRASKNELLALSDFEIEWTNAANGVGKYEAALNGSKESLAKLATAQKNFNEAFSSTSKVVLKTSESLREMEKRLRNLAESGKYTTGLKTDLMQLADRINIFNSQAFDFNSDKAIKEINRIKEEEEELIQRTKAADEKLASQDSISKLNRKIEEFISKNTRMGRKFRKEFEKLKIEWDAEESIDGVKRLNTQFNKLQAEVYAADKAGKSFFTTLSGRIKQMSTNFIAMYFSLYDIVRYFRTAINVIKDLDYALVDLRKTTTMTTKDLNSFYMESSNIAKQLGASSKEIIQQAANWSRLGFSSKEAATEMAKLSSQFAAISPGMSLDTSTDDLVSTMKAFHIEVDNVERDIMDNVNRIGNTFATSNAEIGEMLKRSSAAMNAANNSLKETIALESAAVQITRNAETTGTAFRTISMRIRGYDEETEEFIGNVEQLSGDIADLTKTANKSGGISLFKDADKTEYKSTYELLKEISEIWDELTDKQQAGLLEKLAGKRGGQVLAGILDDFSEVERAMTEMGMAANSADDEMNIVEQSIEFKINALRETWINTLQQLIDRGDIGKLIDLLTSLSEGIGKVIDTLGLVPSILMAISAGAIIRNFSGIIDFIERLTALTVDQTIAKIAASKAEEAEIKNAIANMVANKGLIASEEELTLAKFKDALATTNLTDAQQQQLVASYKQITANQGLKSSFGSVGKSILTTLINPLTLTVAAIGAVAFAAYKTKQANDELRESAEKLGREYKESEQEISNYKNEIQKLQEKIKDSSTSYEDAKDARKRLLEIQDQLIEKYGSEKGAIQDVTDAIEGNIGALDRLSDRKWQETLAEFNNQNLPGWDMMNRFIHGANSNIDIMLQEMEKSYKRINIGMISDDLSKALNSLDGVSTFYEEDEAVITLDGSLEEVYSTLLDIQSIIDRNNAPKAFNEISKAAKDTKSVLDSYADIYDQYIFKEYILDPNRGLDDNYKALQKAYSEYKNAFAEGDEESIELAKESAKEIYDAFNKEITDSTLTDAQKTNVKAWVREIDEALANEFAQSDLELKFNPDISLNDELYEQYSKEIETAINAGFISKDYEFGDGLSEQLIGNIDTAQRKSLEWTEENIDKYGDALASYFENGWTEGFDNVDDYVNSYLNSYSTVDSMSDSFDGVEISFTPIFLGENGPEYLDYNTVHNYIQDLINKANKQGKDWKNDSSVLLNLDSTNNGGKGLLFGQNLGDEAWISHFAGKLGSIADYETKIAEEAEKANMSTDQWLSSFSEKIPGLADEEKEILELISNYSSETELLKDKGSESYLTIEKYADKYGLSVEGLISKLREMHSLYELNRIDNNRLVDDYTRVNSVDTKNRYQQNRESNRRSAFIGGLNLLSNEEYETSQLFNDNEWKQVESHLQNIIKKQHLSKAGAEEYAQAIREVANEMQEASKAAEDFSSKTDFTKDISNLKDLEDELNKLGTAMSNIDENGQFQLGDLDAVADYFIGLTDEQTGLPKVKYEVEAVGDALKLLGEGTGTIEQQADAINTLADNYLRTSGILSGLNEQNQQLYITRLQQMGIINAETIVEQELLAAKNDVINAETVEIATTMDLTAVTESLVSADEDAVNAAVAEIQALLDESNASDATRAAIFNLVAQQTVFNNQGLDVNGKIAALEKLANAFLTTAEAARFEAEMSTVASQAKNMSKAGGMPSDVASKINKNIENKTKQFSDSIGKQTVQFEKAQYNGGSPVKSKLGKSPTSTAGALKDLGNKAIKDAADKAAKGAKDDEKELEDTYDEFFDYFERRVKVLTDAISLLDAHLENVVGSAAKNKLLDAQERIYKMQQQEYADAKRMYEEMANKALAKIPDNIKNDIINGAVAIDEFIGKGNEEVVQAMQDYTKWADKIAECKQQLAELKEQLRQLELKRFKNIAQDWQDLFDLRQNNAIDLIDKQIDLFEEAGQLIGKSFYEEQKAQAQKQYELLSNERKALVDELNRGLSNGTIEIGSDEWLEMRSILSDLEGQILDCAKAIETFDNAILQLHVDVFERIQGQLDDFDDQLSDMASFLDDADVGNKYGEWSQEGMARAGLLAQQFDLANKKVHDYAEEIEWLNEQYKLGKYSTTEYMDRLADLMSEQRDAAQTADDMKDAMVELNRDRVDIVIDGINEEIKAYEELIDAQKKALQAQKDLHDYEKQVADENKAIVDIERQLAAIRNDDSAAANAKRKQLEAQLKDAQDQLSETEYDHSITAQEDALDAQMEQYRQMREAEIQSWEEYAANIEQVMIDMLAMVQANAFEIGTVITETATAHGFQISQALTDPWFTAQQTIAQYGEVLSAETSSFIASLESVEQETWNLQAQADATSVQLAQMFGNRADNLVNELQRSWESEQNLANMTHALSDAFVQALDSGYRIGEVVNPLESAKAATDALADAADSAASAFDNMANSTKSAVNELEKLNSFPTTTTRGTPYSPPTEHVSTIYSPGSPAIKWHKDAYGNIKTRYYAKGLSKAEEDQLAWTQELGDEVIVSPTRSSILTPIKKGDAVIDAKGTQNLFELAKVDPKQLLNGMSSASTPTLQQNKAFGVNISSLVTVNGPINDSLAMMKIAANEAQSKITKTLKDLSDEIKY